MESVSFLHLSFKKGFKQELDFVCWSWVDTLAVTQAPRLKICSVYSLLTEI